MCWLSWLLFLVTNLCLPLPLTRTHHHHHSLHHYKYSTFHHHQYLRELSAAAGNDSETSYVSATTASRLYQTPAVRVRILPLEYRCTKQRVQPLHGQILVVML